NGPSDASNVILSDTLPAGATNPSITPVTNTDGFTFTLANGVFTSNAVTMANGDQDVFMVTVFVPRSLTNGAAFSDTASVTADTSDPTTANNSSTVNGAIVHGTGVWDGGGADSNWTTAANWANDVAPQPGDNLSFAGGAARLTNTNNFPASTSF